MDHRILLVANQTLGGEELAAALRDRVAKGVTELWIVVPATRPRDDFALARVGSGARISVVRAGGRPPGAEGGGRPAERRGR